MVLDDGSQPGSQRVSQPQVSRALISGQAHADRRVNVELRRGRNEVGDALSESLRVGPVTHDGRISHRRILGDDRELATSETVPDRLP